MLVADTKLLLKKLNPTSTRALQTAVGNALSGQHYEITAEHLLFALVDDLSSDLHTVFSRYEIDPGSFKSNLQRYLSSLRAGNTGKPVFSPLLFEWIQDAWIYVSTELGEAQIRSGALLVRLAMQGHRYLGVEIPALEKISREELRRDLGNICVNSTEAKEAVIVRGESSGEAGASGKTPVLGKADGPLTRFCTDLTDRAKNGELDPVFGREGEIRQMVDILVRRRKNNPIIIGEAGVGKTALAEGLALAIVEGNVPEQLRGVHILSLDLGAMQAGASVKGEFENRLKGVIAEVKSSTVPIILFIDEAHTIIGAGAGAGGGDAANLLKPALARGELRTIAATTFAEYKKYFEKDAALERRFQPVKVDEPSVETGILMLRGLTKRFQSSHGVIIQDDAVKAAVTLSARYISGRQLPDKAVDLLDTSAARVKVLRGATPSVIENAKAGLAAVVRELEAYDRDELAGIVVKAEMRETAEAAKAKFEAEIAHYTEKAAAQMAIVERIDALRKEIAEGAADKRPDLEAAISELAAIKPEDRLVSADVDEATVAAIVGDWTGIPVGKMVKDDVAAILQCEDRLRERVRGQDPALKAIARELRAARSGLKPTSQPLGVFLLVGPSGVGKTETALALADLLFGGERFIVTINMSEFQEKHTVSRLIGSPPGYVGFGEGGVLTEAVRHRPYSVVLLDECEKADKDVLNLFYQVFDKGMLSDGEGRVIDFKNTVVILTSNLATDLITSAAAPGNEIPPLDEITALVKPTLSAHFKPALLARMTVVPFIPIGTDALKEIARMKIRSVQKRAKESHGLKLEVDDAVIAAIAARCTEVESGARNVDHILRGSILPLVSSEVLKRIADEKPLDVMRLVLDANGEIACE
jgi:type VI secretion system protein VasG